MTDDELAMAYADGELDPLATRRFEARLAGDAALADAVAAQRRLRGVLRKSFDPVAAEPVPERLTRMLRSNVIPLRPRRRPVERWMAAGAIAASLVIGIAIGRFAGQAPGGVSGEPMIASGTLARTLDRDLAGGQAPTRVLVSFRAADGGYCRVFAAPAIDGIACRGAAGWSIRRTDAASPAAGGAYRQAASPASALLAEAQRMMAGDPLGADEERGARAHGWR